MARSGIALLALRLTALWVALNTVFSAMSLASLLVNWSTFGEHAPDHFRLVTAVAVTLQGILAIVIYVAAPRLAASLSGEPLADPIEDRLAIGALALRIFGILLWARALPILPRLLRTPASEFIPQSGFPWIEFGVLVLLAGLGTLLVVWPTAWSRRLFKTSADRAEATSLLVQAIAFSVLGLWILADVLPEILGSLINAMSGVDRLPGWSTPDSITVHWPSVIANGLRLALGLLLLFGSGTFARAWHRLRTAGLPQSNASAAHSSQE